MPFYRQVVLAKKSTTPMELSQVFQKFSKHVIKSGGAVHNVDHRGNRTLGYPIVDKRTGKLERHGEARLFVNEFSLGPKALPEAETIFKLNEGILRFETFKSRDPFKDFFSYKSDLDDVKVQHQILSEQNPQDVLPMPRALPKGTKKELALQSKMQKVVIANPEIHKFEKMLRQLQKDIHALPEDIEIVQKKLKELRNLEKVPHWKRDGGWEVVPPAPFKPLVNKKPSRADGGDDSTDSGV